MSFENIRMASHPLPHQKKDIPELPAVAAHSAAGIRPAEPGNRPVQPVELENLQEQPVEPGTLPEHSASILTAAHSAAVTTPDLRLPD